MTISDKSILPPEPAKPGIPLKRGTLIGIGALLLVMALVAGLILRGGESAPVAPQPVVKDANELKQVGTAAALEEEREKALRGKGQGQGAGERIAAGTAPSVPAVSAASAPATAASRPSAVTVAPPPGVVRADNSGALYAGLGRNTPGLGTGSSQSQAEVEDATRVAQAKAVVFDEPASTQDGGSATPDRRNPQASMPGVALPTPAQAPSASIAAQIEALRSQLPAQQQQQRPSTWLREYAQEAGQGRQTIKWEPAPGQFVLRKGKVIPAVTEREINSDLPGTITARVRENVYDAEGNLLIPMGSALVGRYDSGIKVGQQRVLFAFEDLILPNGVSFRLPAANGSDVRGAAGVQGEVNNHFMRMFGTSLLIAVLADRTRQPTTVTSYGGAGPVTAAGAVLADTSRVVLERNRIIAPTIVVEQGTRINVEVVADMAFPSAYPSQRGTR